MRNFTVIVYREDGEHIKVYKDEDIDIAISYAKGMITALEYLTDTTETISIVVTDDDGHLIYEDAINL